MTAVWIFFVVGVLVVLAGLIPAAIEAYAFLYAYITTTKELLKKKVALRKEKIDALKAKEVEEVVKTEEVVTEEPVEETVVAPVETPVEPTPVEPTAPVNATEIAHDILGTM